MSGSKTTVAGVIVEAFPAHRGGHIEGLVQFIGGQENVLWASVVITILEAEANKRLGDPELSPEDQKKLQNALARFGEFDSLSVFLEYLRKDDERRLWAAYRSIADLVWASYQVGQATGAEYAKRAFGARARAGKTKRTKTRRTILREAILQVCRNLPLESSSKFATAIQSDVKRAVGSRLERSGYSTRTIQREIGAILKAQRESEEFRKKINDSIESFPQDMQRELRAILRAAELPAGGVP
jgi:hypothetical protein